MCACPFYWTRETRKLPELSTGQETRPLPATSPTVETATVFGVIPTFREQTRGLTFLARFNQFSSFFSVSGMYSDGARNLRLCGNEAWLWGQIRRWLYYLINAREREETWINQTRSEDGGTSLERRSRLFPSVLQKDRNRGDNGIGNNTSRD